MEETRGHLGRKVQLARSFLSLFWPTRRPAGQTCKLSGAPNSIPDERQVCPLAAGQSVGQLARRASERASSGR